MPATATSQLIFFIAAVVVASAVAGVFVTTTLNLSHSIRDQTNDRMKELNTRIAVINDASAMPYNATAGTLVLYVSNIGKTVLDQNKTLVFLDGNLSTSDNMTFRLLDNASEWSNEVVLEVTVGNITLSAGDHQAKVIVQYGKSVTFAFKI
jgi:archaellum component FlaG (FlaF/FlaG flagellin family)